MTESHKNSKSKSEHPWLKFINENRDYSQTYKSELVRLSKLYHQTKGHHDQNSRYASVESHENAKRKRKTLVGRKPKKATKTATKSVRMRRWLKFVRMHRDPTKPYKSEMIRIGALWDNEVSK